MGKYKNLIARYKKGICCLNHVVGLGFGLKEKNGKKTKQEAIIVLVDEKLPPHKLSRRDLVPKQLGDYETDVVEVGELKLLQTRTEKLRPAQPGSSIGHEQISAGTFGAVVKDKRTGQPLILSNNHVLANISNGRDGRAKKGDNILQPAAHDDGKVPNDIIGHLERFIPIERGSGEADCSVAIAVEKLANSFIQVFKPSYNLKIYKQGSANLVDCAVAKPSSANQITDQIMGIGRVSGVQEAKIGEVVQKSGRTTGLTKGTVRALEASVSVRMSQTEVAEFTDQIITDPISKPGDSGSLVLNLNNKALGLLFAGSDKATVCNRITTVLDLLEIQF